MKVKFPLWLVLGIWWIERQQRYPVQEIDYADMLRTLEDMYRSLPLPQNKIEEWFIKRIIRWIDEERERLYLLRSIGVQLVGTAER